jgi:GTPase SAR1 family protein
MFDVEHIEYRFLILGDHKVGKKSLINRFKTMNSTRTYELHDIEAEKEYNKKIKDESLKKKIMTFAKTLTISQFNLDLRFHYIPPAHEKIQVNSYTEDPEENENTHNLNFDKMKRKIEKIIMKPSKTADCRIIFLFLFDLNDFRTFETAKLYYEEIDRFLNISNNYYKALIGSKVDVKTPFTNDEKSILQNFITENIFGYYEVSSKLFFQFEKYFEKMWFDLFEETNEHFSSKYFKERFNNIMTLRQT